MYIGMSWSNILQVTVLTNSRHPFPIFGVRPTLSVTVVIASKECWKCLSSSFLVEGKQTRPITRCHLSYD